MERPGIRSEGGGAARAISEGWDRKCQAISVGIFSRRGGYAARERPMGASKHSSRIPLSPPKNRNRLFLELLFFSLLRLQPFATNLRRTLFPKPVGYACQHCSLPFKGVLCLRIPQRDAAYSKTNLYCHKKTLLSFTSLSLSLAT